jgi:hypothetical protein
MRPLARSPIFALFLLVASLQASAQSGLTFKQYTDQLKNYENRLSELSATPQKAPALRDSVPTSLRVQTTRGEITVDTTFLRDGLNQFLTVEAKARAPILSALTERLRAMRTDADLYEQPSRADDSTRKRLEQILDSREFGRVHGPSALDLLRERIGAWILKQLRKINPSIPDLQNAGQIFVWALIALASSVAAVWLYRISLDPPARKREIMPFLPSSRSWHEWLALAHEQATAGRWRDAIHLGFWAAVSRLESEGAWPPDKARTPREYLRSIPAGSPSQEPFSALTRKFEASWYGERPTTEADFSQFTVNLERLGCR